MTVSSQRLFRNFLTGLVSIALLGGCQSLKRIDLNPFSQGAGSNAVTAPVPLEQRAAGNLDDYPVRQPPPPNRDDIAPASAGSSVVVQRGTAASRLRADAPERYTVVRGDTLWDISALFLKDPWFWPEIWQVNPQIANPHLIYPGDVLSLVWVDGRAQIVMNRGASGIDRMSPQVRVLPLEAAIPTIPYEALAAFLTKPQVLSKREVNQLPYILDIKESHIIAASGFTVYTRGGDTRLGERYSIVHVAEPLYDPDTRKVLGYQAHYVGTGRITSEGDPSRLFLTETKREALRGDRLVNQDINPAQDFVPSAPNVVVDGRIISVLEGVALIGQFQVVVLNRGSVHGLENGNVLSIFQAGETIVDPYRNRSIFERLWAPKVKIPDEQAGKLLIFRTQEDISYGLVMKATSEIKVLDIVTNPQ